MTHRYQEIVNIVRDHSANRRALRAVGSENHAVLLPEYNAQKIKLSKFREVEFYSPEELVISVQAGLSVHELHRLLAKKKQQLCARPRNLSGLSGAYSVATTIGGAMSMGLSGSNRVNHYALRDMLLGVGVINGRGEMVRAGGRVFKNVTGYDWGKLLIGAQGSLGIITDLQLRLMPLPSTECSLVLNVSKAVEVAAIMVLALNSPWDVNGAAAMWHDRQYWQVVLRIQGFKASVQQRYAALQQALQQNLPHLDSESVHWDQAISSSWWEQCNDMRFFDKHHQVGDVWLFTQPAAQAVKVIEHIQTFDPKAIIMWDWGGTQLWCATHQSWQRHSLQQSFKALQSCIRPIRVADTTQRYVSDPDAVRQKILHGLYHQFDPQGVFHYLSPHRQPISLTETT